MTEAEWLASTDPYAMLDRLADRTPRPSDRKWRLLLAGCARQVWDQIPFGPQREAVEMAERYADGAASHDEVATARGEYYTADGSRWDIRSVAYAACCSDRHLTRPHRTSYWGGVSALAGGQLPGLLRCVFGIPFRPPAIGHEWQTPTVLVLAEGIYQHRGFDRLPILADALEDAGCVDVDILAHCRGSGPHVGAVGSWTYSWARASPRRRCGRGGAGGSAGWLPGDNDNW